MKNGLLITALAASILAGTTLVSAYENGNGQGKHGPRMNFDKVDANADGQLTKEELIAHRVARFMRADMNGDGMVSEAELREKLKRKMNEKMERRITKIMDRHDADGNGVLTEAEMEPPYAGRLFQRMDEDGSGSISEAEFDAGMEKWRNHRKHKGMNGDEG